ncbi:MAG TPA: phage holin family protein [Micromonosporaceae bacterium]|nr:phage holin family protein [Micromonosporaceae bacterium]
MAEAVDAGPSRPPGQPSTSELVQRATEQVTKLVRDELALARAELTEKGKHAGLGAGLFGGGGVLALYGVGVLIATAVLLLDLVMPAWLAALIVAVVLFITAGILAMVGRQQVKQATPPMPTAAAESVRADVNAVAAAVKDRGRA